MKHLKKFNELNKETYVSAIDGLEKKGHNKRAHVMKDYIKDRVVSDDEFKFYRNRGAKTVNPKIMVAKIEDIKIIKTPNRKAYKPKRSIVDRLKGDNKEEKFITESNSLSLVVKFTNGEVFKKDIGVEHLQEFFGGEAGLDSEPILFTSRKDAVKFTNICNEKIEELKNKHFPVSVNKLIVNDFYRD